MIQYLWVTDWFTHDITNGIYHIISKIIISIYNLEALPAILQAINNCPILQLEYITYTSYRT